MYITSLKPILKQESTQSLMPSSKSLFKTIMCFCQLKDMVRKCFTLKSQRLPYINFFRKKSILKGRLRIHLVQTKSLEGYKSKQHSNGLQPCYWCKGCVIINSLLLNITLCNQSCFVFYYFFQPYLTCFQTPTWLQ